MVGKYLVGLFVFHFFLIILKETFENLLHIGERYLLPKWSAILAGTDFKFHLFHVVRIRKFQKSTIGFVQIRYP